MGKALSKSWSQLWFLDMNPVIQKINTRGSCEFHDTQEPEYIPKTFLKSQALDGTFLQNLNLLRSGIFKNLLKVEKRIFSEMFLIHVIDVSFSLMAAFLSVLLLKSFESLSSPSQSLQLYTLLPTSLQAEPFWVGLVLVLTSLVIFTLNSMAAALHGQKIEREMLLSVRTQKRIGSTSLGYILKMTPDKRIRYSTGDLTNLVQNDARYIGEFFAHACVDFPVLFVTVVALIAIMWVFVGKAALLGLVALILQAPITWLFSKLTTKWHEKLMSKTDERLGLINEWIQGVRLVRYFGWNSFFVKRIHQLTRQEFLQDIKLKGAFAFTFGVSTAWWMITSLAMLMGMIWFDSPITASSVFAAVWFSGILGQQIVPLPWFVKIMGEAFVASKRLKEFFKDPTSEEQLMRYASTSLNTYNAGKKESDFLEAWHLNKPILAGFKCRDLTLSRGSTPILHQVTFDLKPGGKLAIVGTVGSGKSTLLHALTGDLLPQSGSIILELFSPELGSLEVPLHSHEGISWIQRLSTFVPQEAFIANATLQENVPLTYSASSLEQNPSPPETEVMNSLLKASLELEPESFPQGLHTDLGERGVNLSGGQKQRVSLARAHFATQHSLKTLVFLDDPISAIDKSTSEKVVEELIENAWQKCTLFWITHRLEFLKQVETVIVLDGGTIVEQGSFESLVNHPQSRLNQLILAGQFKSQPSSQPPDRSAP